MQRLLDSAKIYRMALPYTPEQLYAAVVDVVEANGIAPCYIRPIAFRGYGEIGVNPKAARSRRISPTSPGANTFPATPARMSASPSWNRLAPNTMPSLAKAGANYMNSQLIRMEAEINGYSEGIALDVNGYLSEGSGENLFLVRGSTSTPRRSPTPCSAASPATPSSRSRKPAWHRGRRAGAAARDPLHRGRSLLHRHRRGGHPPPLGRSHPGQGRHDGAHHHQLAEEFFGIVNGTAPDRYNWLTPVNVRAAEPVGA